MALILPTVLLGFAALGMDVSRMYQEGSRVQRAADAAALAGVTFLPYDFGNAKATALRVASLNGYTNGTNGVKVDVIKGDLPSQLRVTISSPINNAFGGAIGYPTSTIVRSSMTDYTASAPMGSPCNTFGNEPQSTSGSDAPGPQGSSALPTPPYSNCSSAPQFWAAIEGPATDKVQGDRYMTTPCAGSAAYGCSNNVNDETRPEGYFFAVHVEPQAVGQSIDLQVYDPAYVATSVNCSSIGQDNIIDKMNDYEPSKGKTRYKNATSTYCSGDYNPGGASGNPPDTSYTLRGQTDTGDPMKGAVISGCTQQFRGLSTSNLDSYLRQWSDTAGTQKYKYYVPELARTFHQWVSLCSFTPSKAGDYYLQVRTNVALAGTAVDNTNDSGTSFTPFVYKGNSKVGLATGDQTSGVGLNSFAIRAVPVNSSMRKYVAVAGNYRMPILQNASSSTATFNLIRALPDTAGQFINFSLYDVADGSADTGGSVQIIAPSDATGSIKNASGIQNCRGALNDDAYAAIANCKVPVKSSTHNGKVQRLVIPLPTDYNCDNSTLGGCWFQVKISFAGADVTDFTTWEASIGGQPVRIVS